jgi:hypothetical protein
VQTTRCDGKATGEEYSRSPLVPAGGNLT